MNIKINSNIGKNVIQLPDNVFIYQDNINLYIKNDKKTLSIKKSKAFDLKIIENKLFVIPTSNLKVNSYWGTYRNLIASMITGVSSGFQQNLELFGIGYKGAIQGTVLKLKPGTSHELIYQIPEHCNAKFLTPTLLSIYGANNQLVKETAVQIHNLRKPDAYKGKGIRLVGKTIRLKEGKKQK